MAEAYPFNPSNRGMESFKIPPHSIEAEQAVLGGLLIVNEAWEQIADVVNANDFYRADHRLIFEAIRRLIDDSQPCDVVTLSEELERNSNLDKAGGLSYLGALAQNTPSAANIKAYATIVRQRSVLRQLIQTGNRISERGFNPEGRDVAALLDEAEREVFDIAEQSAKGSKGFKQVKDLLSTVVDRIDELHARDDHVTGVPTGFKDFDNLTSGLQPSDLIIVAGRPSMGKTAFALNMALNAAFKRSVPAAIFSMEMPGEQLVMRLLSAHGINQQHLRTGRLTDDDWTNLTSAISILQSMPIYIDDSPALTPSDLRARARRIKRQHGDLGLVVVDYLQLMQVSGTSENRATEISEISRQLKALAKELNVPVIALSQLNRSVEQRPDKRPVMSDLRESGAIEQDADVIIFIYREEVYKPETERKGIADIIIAKQRNGPIGDIQLTFLGKYTRFENYIPEAVDYGRFE